jgi:hypothetical protein
LVELHGGHDLHDTPSDDHSNVQVALLVEAAHLVELVRHAEVYSPLHSGSYDDSLVYSERPQMAQTVE